LLRLLDNGAVQRIGKTDPAAACLRQHALREAVEGAEFDTAFASAAEYAPWVMTKFLRAARAAAGDEPEDKDSKNRKRPLHCNLLAVRPSPAK
jgi:hypothetical protein